MPRNRQRVPKGKLEYVSGQLEVALAALTRIATITDVSHPTVIYCVDTAREALAKLEAQRYGKVEIKTTKHIDCDCASCLPHSF